VLAGRRQRCVAQAVDREVWSVGLLAGGAVAVHEVAGAHVIGAIIREELTLDALGRELEQVVL